MSSATSVLNLWASSNPFMSGMHMSSTAMSKGRPAAASSRQRSKPCWASPTASGFIRQPANCAWSTSRLVELSSTTRTRSPVSWSGEIDGGAAAAPLTAKGRVAQKVLPLPKELSTPISPPITSVSLREIASPSPVPPYRRVVEASACENDSKSLRWSAASIPIPVSRTSKRTRTFADSCSTSFTLMTTSPEGVNFTAFEARLSRICLMRPASPTSIAGTSGRQYAISSRPLACAASARRTASSSTRVRGLKGAGSRSTLPASSFEKSRMSLIRVSRASPAPLTPSAYWRWVSSKGVSSNRPVSPITPFIGVRISWLIVARNSDFKRLASSAASRAVTNSAWAILRSVMSWAIVATPRMPPVPRIGDIVSETGTMEPSMRTRVVS